MATVKNSECNYGTKNFRAEFRSSAKGHVNSLKMQELFELPQQVAVGDFSQLAKGIMRELHKFQSYPTARVHINGFTNSTQSWPSSIAS